MKNQAVLLLLVIACLVGCSGQKSSHTPGPTSTPTLTKSATPVPKIESSNTIQWTKNDFMKMVLQAQEGDYGVSLEMEDETDFQLTLTRYVEQDGARMGSGIPFRSVFPQGIEEKFNQALEQTPEFTPLAIQVLEAYLKPVDPQRKGGPAQVEVANSLLKVARDR